MTGLVRSDATVLAAPTTDARARPVAVLAAFWAALESPATRRAYSEDWRRFSVFLSARGVDALIAGPAEVSTYLEHLRVRELARSTRSRALSVLREVYSALYRAGLRPDNPAREFRLPRVHREPRTPWLTVDQLTDLLRPSGSSWVARRDRLVLLMLIGLALRRSSVARLGVDDRRQRTDGRLGLHVLAKGAKEADLLVPEWLTLEIESWISFSGVKGPLFPRLRRVGYDDIRPELDHPIGPSKVWEIVKAAAVRAGIDKRLATPHALRRSFVTIARERGVALEDLQAALMHSQTSTTERYDKALRAMRSAPGDVLADIYEAATTIAADRKDREP